MASSTTSGMQYQYSTAVSGGNVPVDLFIRDVPDWTKILDQTMTPLLKFIGGLKAGASPSVPMNKAEWGWGSVNPQNDALSGGIDNATLTIPVNNGAYFQVYDIIRIDNEDLLVTAISGNNLTVSARGFRGTTAILHNSAAVVYRTGIAVPEGRDDPLSPITQGEVDYNYHEIVTMTWELSERAKVTPTYESRNFSGNRFEQELKKKMQYEAPMVLERMLIEGLRSIGNGAGVPSTMGGLRESSYITTRQNISAAPLTETALMDVAQAQYQMVGQDAMAKTWMVSPLGKRIINSWYNDTRRTTGTDKTIGVAFDTIQTDFGDMKFFMNPMLKSLGKEDRMFALKAEDITLRPYASSTAWKTGLLATQGWYDHGYLRADMTTIWENPKARAEIYGFSVNKADYSSLS